jgi:hypothetical protein
MSDDQGCQAQDYNALTWAAFSGGKEVARSDDLGQLLDSTGVVCRRVPRLAEPIPVEGVNR